MNLDDRELPRNAAIALLTLGGIVTLGFLAFWIFLDRDGDPLYRRGAGTEYDRPIQESRSTDAMRGTDPAVQLKPLPPPEGMPPQTQPATKPASDPER